MRPPLWQILVAAKVTDETKLPALSAVWDSLTDMWLKGTLLEVIWTSVARGLLGFLLALAIGTPLGLLVARVKFVRAARCAIHTTGIASSSQNADGTLQTRPCIRP